MRVLSLFSGIGGIDSGLERAGMTVIAQCEADPYCREVLRQHWPDVPCFDDVRTLKGKDIGPVDVICGGYPCQPYSGAGRRKGAEDDRDLWPEMRRLVEELRPAWVLGENVVGHISLGLDDVLSDLDALGYAARPFDISSDACGLPTLERHIWIVATPISQRLQGGERAAVSWQPGLTWEFPRNHPREYGRWAVPEARVCGVGERVPCLLDRVKALGNAVPPQVAEMFGRAMMAAHNAATAA